MITLGPITEAQIRENIVRAMDTVFKTMLRRAAVLAAHVDPTIEHVGQPKPIATRTPQQVVGSVGFLGEANGVIYLCFDALCAQHFLGIMLGMSPAEVNAMGDEPVNDAIGELTNMVAGSFKNALCDIGYPSKLAIPSILRGTGICVQPWPANVVRHFTYPFESDGRRIVVDILMKSEG